jgi:hypothetical protein
MLEKLKALGFKKAGVWVLNDGNLGLIINKHSEKKNILYSFVVDGKIKYIGKTVRTFKKRMSEYHTPGKTQRTNIAKNYLIFNSLKDGKSVEIFLWYDNNPQKYKDIIKINLAAGLEDNLIAEFNCNWNKTGKK